MANPNALIKLGEKALTKGSEKAIEKATTKAVTKATTEAVKDATTKAIAKGIAKAGTKALAPKAGSALDGIIGRSSGITLPEPKITPITLAENTAKYFPGENISTIGGMIDKYTGSNLDKIYKNGGLSKKSYETLKAGAEEAASLANSVYDAVGISNKSKLPKLNREQYYYDTIGKVGKKGNGNLTFEDVPDYMQSHLSNPKDAQEAFVRGGNDEILRNLFNDNESSLSDLYARYEELAQGPNSNAIYTPDNIDMGVGLMGKEGKAAEQDFSDRLFRKKKGIEVSKVSTGAKNVKISRPKAETGAMVPAQSEAVATSPEFADNIASMKDKLGSTGGSGAGMGGNVGGGTTTELPGSDGFNVKLKNGENIDISLKQPMSKSEIKKSRAVRNLDDGWAKGLNATPTQYRDVVAKSKSVYKGYKTPAEMARLNGISLDNINEAPQQVVSAFEKAKQNIEKYAEDRGVNVSLENLDLSNIEPATKATMKMQGIDPDKIRYTGVASPTEAETLYKDLRNRANRTTDGDRAVAYNTMADYVRRQIDNTLDNLNIDFSYEMSNALGEALGKDADRRYLRGIAENKNLKFSDLRREQADWIKIGNLAGRPIKEGPTVKIFGTDTGIPNPLTSGAERLKEKFYERQAYGAGGAGGAGGNIGGGNVPPIGGSGAENNINFEGAGGGTGTLGGLLGRAKNGGLVGAGVLGGLMLGGGSDGGSGGSNGFNVPNMEQDNAQPEIDPYTDLTIGGYNYEQLEAGYVAAMQAGDTDAAKMISNMMGMLDEKVKRYNDAKEKSGGSGTASKQKAAMNVLSGLMQNYQAQGPIGGRATQLLNTLTGGSYNPAVSAYDSGSAGALGTIIKALGDTGALSEGDQKRALELLPKTTDSEAAAKMKYQQLMQILQGAGAQ